MYGKARFTSYEMCHRFIQECYTAGQRAWLLGDGTPTVQFLLP